MPPITTGTFRPSAWTPGPATFKCFANDRPNTAVAADAAQPHGEDDGNHDARYQATVYLGK